VSYRGAAVPNFRDPCGLSTGPSDIRNVLHFSGGYELPFGKGKKFASGATGLQNQVIGGWSINWSTTQEGGQPITIGCLTSPAAGLGCGALKVPGQSVKVGLHTDSNGKAELVLERGSSVDSALCDRIKRAARGRHADGMRAVNGYCGAGWSSSIRRAQLPQAGLLNFQGLSDYGTRQTPIPCGDL